MTENDKQDLKIDEITIKMPIIKDPTDPVNKVQHVVDRG